MDMQMKPGLEPRVCNSEGPTSIHQSLSVIFIEKPVNSELLELYYTVNFTPLLGTAALIADLFGGSFLKLFLHLNSSMLSLISLP